jgi:hypothetical protein
VQRWARSPFATCVRYRESRNGQDPNADGNLYGMENINAGALGRRGGVYSWARNVPRATQDRIAYRLFLRYGDTPWARFDGCHV